MQTTFQNKKKNDQHHPTTAEQIDLTLMRTENHVNDYLSKHGKTALYAVIGVGVLILLMYKFSFSERSGAITEYMQMDSFIAKFQDSQGDKEQKLLVEMQNVLSDYPELQARYDNTLAQSLIIKDQGKEAQQFADRTFKRIKTEGIQEYAEYAKGSLLISQKQFPEALKGAKSLKSSELLKATPLLSALNLYRIALLEQVLENRDAERSAWKEFQEFLAKPENSQIRMLLVSHFIENGTGIVEYVNKRME